LTTSKERPVYDFGMSDSVAKPPWPPGSKDFFQKHGDQEPQLLDMVAKLLDIASRPQTCQSWHRNPPKQDPSQAPQQGKGKDGKGKGKGKGEGGKGKGGNGRGRGKGKGKGKVTMPIHLSRQSSIPVKTSLFDKPREDSDVWGFDKATIEALSQEANPKTQGHYVWSDTSPGTPLSELVLKVLKEARKGDTALFSALRASEQPCLDMKLLTSKIKGKATVEKQTVSNFLIAIAFPTKGRLVSRLDANHDYRVTDGTKGKNETILTEEIALTHRFNTVSQKVGFWPGSCYSFQENYARSSIPGARKDIYARTSHHASHSFTQTCTKGDKQMPHGMDSATYKFAGSFKKGEPGNTTEFLSLFIAECAQCFVPIDQRPCSALWALEDVVHEALSQERSTIEALLVALRELRQLAPKHFHFDVYYSLQHGIIRARLPKRTKDFSKIAKNKKRKPRDPKPQVNAKWPETNNPKPQKRQKHVRVLEPALGAVSLETSANTGTPATPTHQSVANALLDGQLAKSQLQAQQLQQQRTTVTSQLQNEAAPPSSTSIPKTPEGEQGGANPVVETEQK
jgi:hypothetical protein